MARVAGAAARRPDRAVAIEIRPYLPPTKRSQDQRSKQRIYMSGRCGHDDPTTPRRGSDNSIEVPAELQQSDTGSTLCLTGRKTIAHPAIRHMIVELAGRRTACVALLKSSRGRPGPIT